MYVKCGKKYAKLILLNLYTTTNFILKISNLKNYIFYEFSGIKNGICL